MLAITQTKGSNARVIDNKTLSFLSRIRFVFLSAFVLVSLNIANISPAKILQANFFMISRILKRAKMEGSLIFSISFSFSIDSLVQYIKLIHQYLACRL